MGSSSLIAKDNAGQPDQAQPSGTSPGVPGKRTLTSPPLPRTTHDLTDEYVAEPILPALARENILSTIGADIVTACANFNIAITEVRLTKLLKKSDDVPFFLGLLLDVVGAHFVVKINDALNTVRNLGKGLIKNITSNPTLVERTELALSQTTETQVYTYVRTALSTVQGFARRKFTGALLGAPSNTAVTYLDQLRNSIGVAYQNLRHAIPAASDTELLVMREAFDIRHHFVSLYRDAIEEKLKRWEDSGVNKIELAGNYFAPITENDVTSNQGPLSGATDEGKWHDPGTFVEWRQYLSGHKELALKHKGHADKPGDVRSGGQRTSTVPDEFQAEAIARHQEVWGSEPGTDPEIYDDSNYWWDPERAKAAEAKKPKPVAPEPITVPDELKMPANVS